MIEKVEASLGDVQGTSVSVLSSKALELIQTNGDLVKKKAFAKRGRYSDIRVLFVDEAQDLNETQYKIITFIKEATGCTLHLIGDPNQNIYQFRQSFERFMLNHPARQFRLTRNFRCSPCIEAFSNHFQFYSCPPASPSIDQGVPIGVDV